MRRSLLVLSAAGALVACGEPSCPEPSAGFRQALYQSSGGKWSGGTGTFAHADVGLKTLVVERDTSGAPIVRVSYQRGGKTVVETWLGGFGAHPFVWGSDGPPVSFELSPRAGFFDIGPTYLGQTRTQLVTVTNRGRLTTPVTITLEGSGFTLDRNDCASLSGGGTCSYAITFRPSSATDSTTKVTIASGLSPLFTVTQSLFGRGLAPAPDAGRD